MNQSMLPNIHIATKDRINKAKQIRNPIRLPRNL